MIYMVETDGQAGTLVPDFFRVACLHVLGNTEYIYSILGDVQGTLYASWHGPLFPDCVENLHTSRSDAKIRIWNPIF